MYAAISASWSPTQSLITPGANLFGPVMLALWLRSFQNIAIFNVTLFLLALFLLRKERWDIFIFWILINPLTFPSLLTLNKEILTLFCAVLFFRWLKTRRMPWYLSSVILSAAVRWEQAFVLLLFLPMMYFRHRRRAVLSLIIMLSVMGPFLKIAFDSITTGTGQSVVTDTLSRLQGFGLYFAVLPLKLVVMLTSEVVQFWNVFDDRRLHDLQTGLFVLGHQLCMCALLLLSWYKRLTKLSLDTTYFIVIYAVIYCAAPLNQPRYFYFIYVLAVLVLSSVGSAAPKLVDREHEHVRLPGHI